MWFRARIVWSWHTISSRTSQYDDIVAQNWHDDIIAPRYRDLKLHTSSCHFSSEPGYEINATKAVSSHVNTHFTCQVSTRTGVGYMVGRAGGCVGKGWALSTVPCPPPPRRPPLPQRTAGGGIALQYPRWTEEAWELRRTTASRQWLQAYLQSTPVLEKSALSVPWRANACSAVSTGDVKSFNSLGLSSHVLVIGASGYSDDVTISSWTLSRYRDPQKVHDSSPNVVTY